jgi:hypothetical protein
VQARSLDSVAKVSGFELGKFLLKYREIDRNDFAVLHAKLQYCCTSYNWMESGQFAIIL